MLWVEQKTLPLQLLLLQLYGRRSVSGSISVNNEMHNLVKSYMPLPQELGLLGPMLCFIGRIIS